MAYIYRYHFRDPNTRSKINLTIYEKDIHLILETNFKQNLKDYLIKEDYFEFKLYSTVGKQRLQALGRAFKNIEDLQIEQQNIIRMQQKLYAIAYPPEDENDRYVCIEFVDSELIESESYKERAYDYLKKLQEDLSAKDKYSELSENVVILGYLDVLESYVEKEVFLEVFGQTDINQKTYFLIKGWHRRYDIGQEPSKKRLISIEKNYDYRYIKYKDEIDKLNNNKQDYLDITSIKKGDQRFNDIEKELEPTVPPAEDIDVLSDIFLNDWKQQDGRYNSKKMVFQTYSVGQGLATSLSFEKEKPFLYFDYGFSCNLYPNKDSKNKNIGPYTATIILSHSHNDHWRGINHNIDAFKYKWYIANQILKAKMTWKKKVSEIIDLGGFIRVIDKNMRYKDIRITSGGISKCKENRIAKSCHETGLTMRIEAKDCNGKPINIFIPGDQSYDYIDDTQLKDLDILVATHHGGKYNWSKKCKIPVGRNEYSIIIYCYGEDNSHGHPSKLKDYQNRGWMVEHHTSINGDYKKVICFE